MDSHLLTLAQINANTDAAHAMDAFRQLFSRLDILNHPGDLLDALSTMPLIAASVSVIVGSLCVLNGYRWHRWVVVVLAFFGGLGLGDLLSSQMGRSQIVAVAIGLLCAIVATPLLKVAVALFAGVTGAFIGGNVWTAMNATPVDAQWAGAAMGFILLAMTSLIMFRLVIVLFTSVGGAAMVVFGGLTLLMQVDAWNTAVRSSLTSNEMLIPLLVGIAAVGGFVLQESRLRTAHHRAAEN